MQLPLIKDGIVVNIVELSEDTLCVDKPTHRQMAAQEEAEYEGRASVWRAAVAAHNEAIRTAEIKHFMALGAATAIKADARKANGDAAATLDRVLVADAEVEAWATKVSDMKAAPPPEKPLLRRAPRWIYPEDCEVGPAGGNIGDSWDGRAYTAPLGKTTPEKAVA